MPGGLWGGGQLHIYFIKLIQDMNTVHQVSPSPPFPSFLSSKVRRYAFVRELDYALFKSQQVNRGGSTKSTGPTKEPFN